MTTDLAMARSAKDALLADIGDDPRVQEVQIALTRGDGYRLKVRLRDDTAHADIPRLVDGVEVLVAA